MTHFNASAIDPIDPFNDEREGFLEPPGHRLAAAC